MIVSKAIVTTILTSRHICHPKGALEEICIDQHLITRFVSVQGLQTVRDIYVRKDANVGFFWYVFVITISQYECLEKLSKEKSQN